MRSSSPARASRVHAFASALAKVAPRSLGARLEQARRDVDVVLQGFRGSHPSPLIARDHRRRAASSTLVREPQVAPGVRHLVIRAIHRETPDALTLTLADQGGPIPFRAGQFLMLRADVAGQELWRAYSICTAPRASELAVTIKRVANGRVSNHLHEHAAVGQVLEARGPSGRFTLEPAQRARHLVLLAGGSGITPLLSHVRHALETEPQTRISLIYGSRRSADIIFRDALSALVEAHGARLTVRHVVDEMSDPAFGQGPLDAAALTRELEHCTIVADEETYYLVCGPEPMMQACRDVLALRSVPDTQVLEERFFGLAATDDASSEAQDVTFRLAAGEATVRVNAGETILEAALRERVPVDFSCAMGGCGACMATLVEGEVHMPEPNCLTKRERGTGKILTCIAKPKSPCRVEQRP